tara:strand:- start:1257 stop:1814 length:558 start_codon:yes stop_codon:yes gene_type:complete
MKKLLLIFILTFSLQSWIKAEDIRDFEIEGISIGKSVLDFYSKKKIKENYADWFEPKYGVTSLIETRGNYDEIQLMFKKKDPSYTIDAISAIKFTDPIYCLKKIDEIKSEIQDLFDENVKVGKKKTFNHSGDKSGKSKVTSYNFVFKDTKDLIIVACYDWSEKMKWWDNLRISVRLDEYDRYISR